VPREKKKSVGGSTVPREKKATISAGGLFFASPTGPGPGRGGTTEQKPARARATRARARVDPQLAAKARELRDRYLERVNAEPGTLSGCGKYAVARELGAPRVESAASRARLDAA